MKDLIELDLDHYLITREKIWANAIEIAQAILDMKDEKVAPLYKRKISEERWSSEVVLDHYKDSFFSPEIPILMCTISYYYRSSDDSVRFPASYLYNPQWPFEYDKAIKDNAERQQKLVEEKAIQLAKSKAEAKKKEKEEEYQTYLKLREKYEKYCP